MLTKEIRQELAHAFTQNEGWTKQELAQHISGHDSTTQEFADVMAYLDVLLPRTYYCGRASEHNRPADVWYSSRKLEKERRLYR